MSRGRRKDREEEDKRELSQGNDYSVQQVQTWARGVADTAIYVRVYTVDG